MRKLVILAVGMSLAACTPGITYGEAEEFVGSVEVARGAPDWIDDSEITSLGVGVDTNQNIVVVTMGSSSNPHRVTKATINGHNIDLVAENEPYRPSTMDLAPTTSTVTFPDGLPSEGSLTVGVAGFDSVDLDPAGGEFVWLKPAATQGTVSVNPGAPDWIPTPSDEELGLWGIGVDERGNLVLLTYGSSSNPWQVTEASFVQDEITLVVYMDPDAISTADIAPTTSLVTFPESLPTNGLLKVDLGDLGAVTLDNQPGSWTWFEVELEFELE